MGQPWQTLLGIAAGFLIVWIVLVLTLWRESRRTPSGSSFGAVLRLVPDVARLLRRLAADRTVPRRVRVWLTLLLIYLISPIDLIPDFVPVLGYADDALVVAISIRFATRGAGSEAIRRHWSGTPEGLASVLRFAGLG